MTVHPNSVISNVIGDFSQSLYDKLTDMENYCYEQSTQSEGSEENYKPFFEELNQGILDWFEGDLDEQAIFDLMQAIYSFIALNIMYDYRDDLKSELPAPLAFNMGGFIDDVDSYSIDHYDDIVMAQGEDEDGNTISFLKAENIEADIAKFNPPEDPEPGQDPLPPAIAETNSNIIALRSKVQQAVQRKINKLLYQDEEILNSLDKSEMYEKVFVEYEYDTYIEFLNIEGVDPFEDG